MLIPSPSMGQESSDEITYSGTIILHVFLPFLFLPQNERTKFVKPAKSHHRHYTLANPYTALVRDGDNTAGRGDSDEERGKGTENKDVVASLHTVIEHHHKAEDRLRAQVQALKASHTKVRIKYELPPPPPPKKKKKNQNK